MIVGNHFIYLHMGKTGGNTIYKIFNKYLENDIVHIIHNDPFQHANLEMYNDKFPLFNVYNKDVILGFRKLPDYIISNNRHRIRWLNKHRKNKLDEDTIIFIKQQTNLGLLLTIDEDSDSENFKLVKPEEMLTSFIEHKFPKYFIRQEYLFKDFHNIFSKYIDNLQYIDDVHENINNATMPLTIDSENLDYIYKENPTWATIEKQIYD